MVGWQWNDAPKPRECMKDAQSQTGQGKKHKMWKNPDELISEECGTRSTKTTTNNAVESSTHRLPTHNQPTGKEPSKPTPKRCAHTLKAGIQDLGDVTSM